MPQEKYIQIRGARENNLKNVAVDIPKNKLVVFTGLSGSGKSSLAFDTIYAEGQRRYLESLSSYARQFLGQMKKPDVDSIDGLTPAISISQKSVNQNPRSTVGTITEIYDYLRLLYAKIGVPHCPKCGKEIKRQSVDQIVDQIIKLPEGTRIQILAPVIRGKKGEHRKVLDQARKNGYVRVRMDGVIYDLSEEIKADKNKRHSIEIVIDRLVVRSDMASRLEGSVETASALSGGLVMVHEATGDQETMFSQNYSCSDCEISMPELSPRMFSFNSPYGACKKCMGLGFQLQFDEDLVLPDRTLSINGGGIKASGWNHVQNPIFKMYFKALGDRYGFDLDMAIQDISPEAVHAILYGTDGEALSLFYEAEFGSRELHQPFEGVIPNMERRYHETNSESERGELEQFMTSSPCPDCHGDRLSPLSLAVTVGGMNISDFCRLSISDAFKFISELELSGSEAIIAGQIRKEIIARLNFLKNVGLEYLSLTRSSGTLSGGESQRIRLATQIGSGLIDVLYIFDEPSIGLHPRDNERLLSALRNLKDSGNSLIVVEHDEETIRNADWIVDIGPGAGVHGGEVVAEGTLEAIMAEPKSITGRFLSGKEKIPVPAIRRPGNGHYLTIFGAAENNLKKIDVKIPLGTFTFVTGVSGSGKSSLVNEILYKKLQAVLNHARTNPGKHTRIEGMEYLDKIVDIDQSPIGRTPRSNPATYIGLFDDLRQLFASTNTAKMHAFGPGRFSFNIKGGRCEACMGDGVVKIEMQFLPDVYIPCDVCKGKRFNRETLEVQYKGKNIAEVLETSADEALAFFENIPRIRRKIGALCNVGLGYIQLGQSSTTLSGGEAQRVKLAAELARRSTGSTIYVLDEPTTGLHFADVRQLIHVLQALVDQGNTVIVIEHNLEMIKTADYIIDLGPEGGTGGGSVVCCGTPEQVAKCDKSYTGKYLRSYLPEWEA